MNKIVVDVISNIPEELCCNQNIVPLSVNFLQKLLCFCERKNQSLTPRWLSLCVYVFEKSEN